MSSEGKTSTDGYTEECDPLVLQFLPSTISANSKDSSFCKIYVST